MKTMTPQQWYEAKTYYHTIEQKTIEIKMLPETFKHVASHRKTFDIRRDEDDIQPGDIILFREWDGKNYTRHQTRRIVTYVQRDSGQCGLANGYCIIGFHSLSWDYVAPSLEITQVGESNSHIVNAGTVNINLK